MPSVHGPSALFPVALKELGARILPRLRLIPEFKNWLPPPSATLPNGEENKPGGMARILWNCLVQGRPLLTLLDLLGSGACGLSRTSIHHETEGTLEPSREEFLSEFLRRIELLEAQGHLSYGEIFRVEELLDGSTSGFIKVLSTVERVLKSLEATYPNLYELSDFSAQDWLDALERFHSKEFDYLLSLQKLLACVTSLNAYLSTTPHVLECLIIYVKRICTYQELITDHLRSLFSNTSSQIDWVDLFAMARNDVQISGTGAYQSYCTEYPPLVTFVDDLRRKNSMHEYLRSKCTDLSVLLPRPLIHVLSYPSALFEILKVTHPVKALKSFNSLCVAHSKFVTLSGTILEVAQCVRTAHAATVINQRAFFWRGPDPATLGDLILDDCISVGITGPRTTDDLVASHNGSGGSTESFFHAFLFEQTLLLCGHPDCEEGQEVRPLRPLSEVSCRYPIASWELGPALRANGSLSVVYTVATSDILRIYRPEAEELSFDLVWDMAGSPNTMTLNCGEPAQLEQWLTALRQVSPNDVLSISLDVEGALQMNVVENDLLHWESQMGGLVGRQVKSKARPWSLIARKEGTPSSSLYNFSGYGSELSLLSPTMSPRFIPREAGLSTSPRSLSPLRSQKLDENVLSRPETPISSKDTALAEPRQTQDLTGQIIKLESYPAAHGGFADVWKCNWNVGSETHKVAVKVLRGRLFDSDREEKMTRRLNRELRVWQRLDHENVIPLYGTCADFGRYVSLVCPWYDNGSVQQYLTRHSNELYLKHRLKLLSEIASGLTYLHSFSIVHGDLSSSNVLINDRKQACICDFGLSTVVEDFMDTSYPSSMLGGAIRWAAPELYRIPDRDQPSLPHVSMSSDVYSYGSIALEILSGKVPYYYLKHDGQVLIELNKKVKPERPASDFVTNELWRFIEECWNDVPDARPTTVEVSSRILQLHQRTLARHSI